MKTTIATFVFAVTAAFGFVAQAQESSSSRGAAIRQGDNGTPVIYDHASTLEEGVLRGGADLLRGIGDMNYSNSLAMINATEAHSRGIDNHKSAVQTWFDVRSINRQARAMTQSPRVSASDAARRAHASAPKGLSAMEFDVATGRLIWPVALQDGDFTNERNSIDALVATHGVEVREVKMLANQLNARLKDRIHELPTGEYVAAKRFLRGLQADAAYGPSVASR